jgi:hypothetical protein
MLYDSEVMTIERTHRTERKDLTNRNRELRNTVRALRVSATYIRTCTCTPCTHAHTTHTHTHTHTYLAGVLLGAAVLSITGPSERNRTGYPVFLGMTLRLLRPQNWSYQCGEVNSISPCHEWTCELTSSSL